MSQERDDRPDPLKVTLIIALLAAVVVWAVSTVFGISLVKALAWVVLLLFVTALAAVVLGISPF